jgi:hypothetical protein
MNAEQEKLLHRAQTLGTLSDAHPVWCVLMELLAEDETAAAERLCQPSATDAVRHFQAGYLAHVRDLRDLLRGLREEGMKRS